MIKATRRLQLALLAGATVLIGACPLRHGPVPPLPALTVDKIKAICPTAFAVAEIPGGKSCDNVAVPLGLRALPRYLPTLQLRQTTRAAALPLAQLPDGERERRVGKQTFCVFAPGDSLGNEPAAFKAALERVAGPGLRAVADCGVLRSTDDGSPGPDQLEPLTRTTIRQVRGFAGNSAGQILSPAAPWMETSDPGSGVRVAVVDASPYGLTKPDNSGHGYAVARAVALAACADANSPACATRLPPYNALPMGWVKGQPQPQILSGGGFFGHLHQLADAIENAVDDWVKAGQRERLIINLSLGWDPAQTRRGDPDVAMVLQQLRRAACGGALVIAAAGNATLTRGPLAPASWESLPAGECAEFEGGPMKVQPPAPGNPLVYAAAGLDQGDVFLQSTRPGGRPERAAFGLFATMKVAEKTYAGPFNGTSAAAAFTSGIAAATWARHQEVGAARIADTLYRGGEIITKDPADFCVAGRPCLPPRRVSLCGALRVLDPATACATVPFATAMTADLVPAPPAATTTSTTATTAPVPPPAGDPLPWVEPQDPEHPCITCAYSQGSDLLWTYTRAASLREMRVESFDNIGRPSPWNPFFLPGTLGGLFIQPHVGVASWNARMRIRWQLIGTLNDYFTTDDVMVVP